jgi:hypothetical protein
MAFDEKEYRRNYYAKNKEHIKAINKEWKAKNPERNRAAVQEWYAKNREYRLSQKREYWAKNKQRFKTKARERSKTPEYRARQRERERTPERKARRRELAQTPKYRAWRLEYDRKNRERLNVCDKKWREDNAARYIFNHCKKRAEIKGIKFSLTLKWIETRLAAGICERTGHTFTYTIGSRDCRNPWFPSIDRIDSSLGYTKDNCQIVCLIYNIAKNRWTDAIMLEMVMSTIEYRENDPLA